MPCAYAQDDDDSGRRARRSSKDKDKDDEEEEDKSRPKGGRYQLSKEMEGLKSAISWLEDVKDEKSASDAARRIIQLFNGITPRDGSVIEQAQLDSLARSQNRVNAVMKKLMKEDYFVKSGLQDAWTVVTDPSSRRCRTR